MKKPLLLCAWLLALTAPMIAANVVHVISLSRSFDGRIEGNRVTEDEADVRRWLTVFERLPLFATADLELNSEYYVRVRARTQPHDSWLFWPWDRGLVSANANFTFIP